MGNGDTRRPNNWYNGGRKREIAHVVRQVEVQPDAGRGDGRDGRQLPRHALGKRDRRESRRRGRPCGRQHLHPRLRRGELPGVPPLGRQRTRILAGDGRVRRETGRGRLLPVDGHGHRARRGDLCGDAARGMRLSRPDGRDGRRAAAGGALLALAGDRDGAPAVRPDAGGARLRGRGRGGGAAGGRYARRRRNRPGDILHLARRRRRRRIPRNRRHHDGRPDRVLGAFLPEEQPSALSKLFFRRGHPRDAGGVPRRLDHLPLLGRAHLHRQQVRRRAVRTGRAAARGACRQRRRVFHRLRRRRRGAHPARRHVRRRGQQARPPGARGLVGDRGRPGGPRLRSRPRSRGTTATSAPRPSGSATPSASSASWRSRCRSWRS